RALEDDELRAAAAPGVHPSGNERGLVACFTFEDDATATRSIRLHGAAARVPVSGGRDDANDAARIPLPKLEAPMLLPFEVGEAGRVLQGNDENGGSHNGYAAFSWDFVLAGRAAAQTRGRNVRATGPGEVVFLEQGAGNNAVKVRQ